MSAPPSRPAAGRRSARPERAPVARVADFDVLDQTHREVVAQLARLAELVAHLDRHGVDAPARTMAREIATFFNGHARAHHADEEARVFPPLLADGAPELVQHVQRLQQDHGWLEEDWLELAPQLEAVADGYSWYDLAMPQHALPIFTVLFRDHISLEETLVYPEAKRRQAALDAGERARVTPPAPSSS